LRSELENEINLLKAKLKGALDYKEQFKANEREFQDLIEELKLKIDCSQAESYVP